MVWRIEFTSPAEKALEWVKFHEPDLFSRVITCLEALRVNPYQGKALKGELVGRYSYRVGSYRIIYKLRKGELLVVIIDIGHRRDIYK